DLADLKQKSEQRYRDLAESMPQIVWTADAHGRLTYRNRRWYDCAGLANEPEQPLDWDVVVHPEELASFRRQWTAARDAHASWEAEYRFGSVATGAYRWHLVRAVAVKRDDGQTTWI